MCGLFGFVGESDLRSSLLLQTLCIVDESRGKDSTGLLLHENAFRSKLIKRALKGSNFVAEGNTEVLFKVPYTMALGHNRAATAGAITDRNAHPFPLQVGERLWDFGMQNGTLPGGLPKTLAEKYGVEKADVDTETYLRCIAALKENGTALPDAIEGVTEAITPVSDFAFAYISSKDESLYLWRNIGRPLCIIDARKYNLGRWFCSTKDIFLTSWGILRGYLGDPEQLVIFDAYPYRLYKVSVDGIYEVEPIRELAHTERPPAPKPVPVEYVYCDYESETFGGGPRRGYQGNLGFADDFPTEIDGDMETPDSSTRMGGRWSNQLRRDLARKAGDKGIKGLSGSSHIKGYWDK